MLAYLADEDFDNRVLRALRRRSPHIDWLRVQDVGLSGAADSVVLDWAAEAQRVVLTHDVSTMTAAAYQRVQSGLSMAGVAIVPQRLAISAAVDDLHLLAELSDLEEWRNQVLYLPL